VADAGPAGAARETAVGDQGDALTQPHPHDRRGRRQHLGHARSALGTAVADHHHITGLDPAAVDRGDGLLLAVKYPRRTLVVPHPGGHSPGLDGCAPRRKIAEEERQTATEGVRIPDPPDHLLVVDECRSDVLTQAPAGHGEGGLIQQPGYVGQLFEDGGDAPGAVDVLDVNRSRGRRDLAEVGHPLRQAVDLLQIDLDPRLVRDGQGMQDGVGRSAHGQVEDQGVVKSLRREDIQGLEIACEQFHHRRPAPADQLLPAGIDGEDGPVARQGHAKGLHQTVHAVGGEHP